MQGKKAERLKFYWLIFCLISGLSSYATHYRAGEIIYTLISPLTYEVQVITYTKFSGVSASADRDSIDISWGDGTSELISRVNGVDADGDGVPEGEVIFDDIKQNIYRGRHQYPGIRPFYVISILDPNRIDNIINISGGASVNVPFYIEDTLKFFDIPSLGYNNSPVLLNPPIDFANINDTFYHNPSAYDMDGDSLFFRLIPPKQNVLSAVPAYQYPNQIIPGANNRFNINSATGELLWGTPQRVGIYNIAILVEEYRNSILLGTLIRDMQIIVNDYPNDPPQIDDVRDTCIIAGTKLGVIIRATDPQLSQTVSMRATGGPFEVAFNPATFFGISGNAAYDTFYWNTDCSHIRSQFYSVVINASDNFSVGTTRVPLVDLETWLIRVIAPAPENVTATPFGNAITINWQNPYSCSTAPNFRSFSVWRKIGSNPFIPDSCETGLAGRGYEKIADGLTDYRYRDADVVRGQVYCYRVLAHFSKLSPNGLVEYDNAESIPSNEVCAELKKDVPVLLHADVIKTDTVNGQVFVDWSMPRIPDLDTIQNPGPYKFELKRSIGIGGSSFISIRTFNSLTFDGLRVDTFYTDSLINTLQNPHTYTVDFFAQSDSIIGSTNPGSTVFLQLFSGDKQIRLDWSESVPWTNYIYYIYKSIDTGVSFVFLDSISSQSYLDTGLNNGSLYCYYVESYGVYSSRGYVKPLINKSQRLCSVPIDTVPPCAPVLRVSNDCGLITDNAWGPSNFVNRLNWTRDPSCSADLRRFRIYFRSSGSNQFVLIDSTNFSSDTSYIHDLSVPGNNLSGCYQVTSVDSVGNESDSVVSVCIDNCPNYLLPNVFTPNGDGFNDFFRPFLPYRFVSKIDMEIFDRWGNRVFKTDNPDILWDGNDQRTGKALSEGVYFYKGTYTEKRLDGEHTKPLPSKDNGAGFIHLMRDK